MATRQIVYRFALAASGIVASGIAVAGGFAQAAEADNALLAAATASIRVEDIRRYADTLAADVYEGREAGSRGGHAAGGYLVDQLRRLSMTPAGEDGGYFQYFRDQYRNVLTVVRGSDPTLSDEVVVVGAHYDHVGYGSRGNSNGGIGSIHNGADDNASGVATLLEVAEALTIGPPPRRSVLFALWDGEEKGLLGSEHWVEHPTVPLDHVAIMFNLDMVGRLRQNRLEVAGTRTSVGLRRLVSEQNGGAELELDFTWEIKNNSDHYPFYLHRVPILMLHTGLHSDYHRSTDDAEKLNVDGMTRIAQLGYRIVHALADRSESPPFRAAVRRETNDAQRRSLESPLPPLPRRLGVSWSPEEDGADGLVVAKVIEGAPAERAGFRVGDRIVRFNDHPIRDVIEFRAQVLAAPSRATFVVERDGAVEPVEISVELEGFPVRWGISWRSDDGEPGSVVVVRVVQASPAAVAGLEVSDRILEVEGRPLAGATGDEASDALSELLAESDGPLEFLLERDGRLRPVAIRAIDSGLP